MEALNVLELKQRLQAELDARLPRERDADPRWSVFALQNPAAPVVTVSRDPRAGAPLTPVFFLTARDENALLDFAKSLYRASHEKVRLWHSARGSIAYVVIPALFHVDPDTKGFVSALTALVEDFAACHAAAWICEDCVVKITHHGQMFQATVEADSLRVVQWTASSASTRSTSS
jgi:hypothetical protein